MKKHIGQSGIYMWTSPTGRKYIGQAVDLARRKTEFLCWDKRYGGIAIERARKKYQDKKLWSYQILERCEVEQLDEREAYWINEYDTYNNGLNMTYGGGGKGIRVTAEHVRKWRISRNKTYAEHPEIRTRIAESVRKYYEDKDGPMKGRHHSEEQKEKWSEKRLGKQIGKENPFYGRKHSQEQMEKWQRERKGRTPGNKGKGRIIQEFTLDGQLIKEWNTITEAAAFYNCSISSIWSVLRGKCKTIKGHQWKYKEETTKFRRCVPVTINGVTYPSKAEAARQLGVSTQRVVNILKRLEREQKKGD